MLCYSASLLTLCRVRFGWDTRRACTIYYVNRGRVVLSLLPLPFCPTAAAPASEVEAIVRSPINKHGRRQDCGCWLQQNMRVYHWLAWREMIPLQAARRSARRHWALRPPTARRPQCAGKWDRNLKPKLAIMRQCTSVTDRRSDRRTDIMA